MTDCRFFCEFTLPNGTKFTFGARNVCQLAREAKRYREMLDLPEGYPCRVIDFNYSKMEYTIR